MHYASFTLEQFMPVYWWNFYYPTVQYCQIVCMCTRTVFDSFSAKSWTVRSNYPTVNVMNSSSVQLALEFSTVYWCMTRDVLLRRTNQSSNQKFNLYCLNSQTINKSEKYSFIALNAKHVLYTFRYVIKSQKTSGIHGSLAGIKPVWRDSFDPYGSFANGYPYFIPTNYRGEKSGVLTLQQKIAGWHRNF